MAPSILFQSYFYPRPPRGGRPILSSGKPTVAKFLSTPSARRATGRSKHTERSTGFLSTPSARRATWPVTDNPPTTEISIHALREEGDASRCCGTRSSTRFLSTPSARRATITAPLNGETNIYFYPRPPRGGRHPYFHSEAPSFEFLSTPSARRATTPSSPFIDEIQISIHALREEGDAGFLQVLLLSAGFLSTPSARRAT